MIPATMIIKIAQNDACMPSPFQWIETSQAAILTKAAMQIQPRYRQKGHHRKTMVEGPGSVNSISVRRTIFTSEKTRTNIISTDNPIYPCTQARIQQQLA